MIGHNDVLNIGIEDAPELSGTFRVNSKGKVVIPIVGDILAEGKTVQKIINTIVARLKGGYLVNPIVSVDVGQSNSRAYFIQGAVQRPGTYQIEGNVSLLNLIAIAGGLTKEHGSEVVIIRSKEAKGHKEDSITTTGSSDAPEPISGAQKIDIDEVLSGDVGKDITIKPGDIVNIPVAKLFFVNGAVGKAGSFPIRGRITLLEAVSLAGGFSETSGTFVYITRTTEVGKGVVSATGGKRDVEVIKVEIEKLMRGLLEKNVIIRAGDFIYVEKKAEES